MGTIVLHRLADWPVYRHLAPLLARLELGGDSLERVHYAFTQEVVGDNPFSAIPEEGGVPGDETALLAVGGALAESAREPLGARGGTLVTGFHWSATAEKLEAAAREAGHDVVGVAELVARGAAPTAEFLRPLLDKWELAEVKAMLRSLPKGVTKAATRYVNEGGPLPTIPRVPDLELAFYWGMSSFTERHGRILDVFVAATGGTATPTWTSSGEKGGPLEDAAGALRDLLVARGVSEAVVRRKLAEPTKPGSSQRAFGHKDWPSLDYLLVSSFAHLDEIPPAELAALFEAQRRFPRGLRVLAGLVTERWCRHAGGFATLDLEGLAGCTHLDAHRDGAAFEQEAARLYRRRVLASPDLATLPRLVRIADDSSTAGALTAAETKTFQGALAAALASDATTLEQLRIAQERRVVDGDLAAKHVLPPFRRAIEAGFAEAEHGFGDNRSFAAFVPVVAAKEPDLCLRAFAALSERYNENGLRYQADDWDALLPKSGYSKAALAEASRHFSSPAAKAASKILKRLLATRGVVVERAPVPPLAQVDSTFTVGTDVAHLLVGSWDAVSAVSDVEDPDDWPSAVRKHKCIGLQTGGDGAYTVRVLGAEAGMAAATLAPRGASLVARFPLVVKGDDLTVSGLVGAGGAPTIPCPSGSYAADVFEEQGGAVLVVLSSVEKAPAWPGKKGELPSLG